MPLAHTPSIAAATMVRRFITRRQSLTGWRAFVLRFPRRAQTRRRRLITTCDYRCARRLRRNDPFDDDRFLTRGSDQVKTLGRQHLDPLWRPERLDFEPEVPGDLFFRGALP